MSTENLILNDQEVKIVINYICKKSELIEFTFYLARACRPDQKYFDP